METEDIQTYIHEHIPIVKENRFAIEADESPYVSVTGTLKDHINHRNSAFGGSLSTALILSAWASVRSLLRAHGVENGIIVIQSQTVRFDKPVTGDFTARTLPIADVKVAKFIAMLTKFGKSRLKVESYIAIEGTKDALTSFEGDFVVVLKD